MKLKIKKKIYYKEIKIIFYNLFRFLLINRSIKNYMKKKIIIFILFIILMIFFFLSIIYLRNL